MENFFAQTFTIRNHPISGMKEKYRLTYVMGLGEFMRYITNNDPMAKTVFEIWCISIIGSIPDGAWSHGAEFKSIKAALSRYWKFFGTFTMRMPFLFDCFYLLEKSNNPTRNAYSFLNERICGYFTQKILKYTYQHFNGFNDGERLPIELRNHRIYSQEFASKRVKRVLIVATMSAGKSTLVNALVGHSVCKVKSTACTSRIHYIYNKPSEDVALAKDTNQKIIYTNNFNRFQTENFDSIGINFTSTLNNKRICLIDTPGVNYYGDKSHGEMTKEMIKGNNYDLLLLVMNGQQLAIDDERDFIDYIGKHSKSNVIGVLNQCDVFKPSQDSVPVAIDACKEMMTKAGIKNPLVVPISAYVAFLSRQSALRKAQMDEDDLFDYEHLYRKMQKPFYNFPSYLTNAPKNVVVTNVLERSCVPYLEHLIKAI